MNRRAVLGAGAAAGLSAVAGCLTGAFDDDASDDAVLGPPEDLGERGEPIYPTYGDPFPEFELADPIEETSVDVAAIDDDCLVCTAFFASCPAECIPLINSLSTVQANTFERGIDDRARFLAITFDPERDTAEELSNHADIMGVDLEAGNWHYLRPEDQEEAQSVVHDELGIPFEREDLGDDYDFRHITVTFLVNPDGYVERSYRGENPDSNQITDDLEQVLDDW
ncbi:SCO family protein [Natronobacterium texcoconense]|uniref:Protein SCO1/2 n=1 Tax=Natronobacterium texcoconense TaxID=1095778 RepID=A0A1H1GRE4_NATTX|nr:SCO family protein [Natronobacterium texcoconense]SDR15663.1 protein SCO1/2 [Natronobacterium texcoconense]